MKNKSKTITATIRFDFAYADVGIDLGTPVVEAIGSEAKSRFTGGIPKVTLEVREPKPAEKASERGTMSVPRTMPGSPGPVSRAYLPAGSSKYPPAGNPHDDR